MRLLVVYCVFLAIGGVVCVGIGDIVDRYSTTYGLTVFLLLFFLNLWVSWRLAIRATEPGHLLAGNDSTVPTARHSG